jgi:hypothetical protein
MLTIVKGRCFFRLVFQHELLPTIFHTCGDTTITAVCGRSSSSLRSSRSYAAGCPSVLTENSIKSRSACDAAGSCAR